MPDQAPVAVTCSVWVPSTCAGGISPDGQLTAVHSSVIVVVVPGLLFHTYQPVAAEAPPYPVPVKDAGTDNPSSKLGLFRIPAVTVKLSPLLDLPFTMTTTFPVVAPAGAATTMLVSVKLVGSAAVPIYCTVLIPGVVPKFVPVIVTTVPTGPVVIDRLVMLGAIDATLLSVAASTKKSAGWLLAEKITISLSIAPFTGNQITPGPLAVVKIGPPGPSSSTITVPLITSSHRPALASVVAGNA